MNQTTYNTLKNFVWGIANECLVDVYDVGDYRKVILPMLVIRRFDAILEPFHDKIIEQKKIFDSKKIEINIVPAMETITGQNFVNTSPFTLKDLKSRTDRQNLERDFKNYLDGFSDNVQKIIEKFHFREQIPRLVNQDRLGLLIEKFLDPKINLSNSPILNDDGTEKLEALDNHAMGTLFEEVIRMFNEQTNVTDAGRHFTPRDIVELIADLAFIPIQDKIKDSTYSIYDGACGTGGMLTVGESRIKELAKEHGKAVSTFLFGQENFDETYAIAQADMLIKGEGNQNEIKFGSTISDDKFSGETFDFMLSNPPFGTSWKAELGAGSINSEWKNYTKKNEIADHRFLIDYDRNPEFSLVPDIGDPQMLFLANNISKVKTTTPLGSRIVEVHNGSSLFTGSAGQGASNLRRYIIENDMLEAIVALPEKMFYNTGIGTYLWIVTNKKDERRKGTVQLIDATSLKSTLRKNIGEKNCEITPAVRKKILEIYLAYKDADENFSKVFPNEEFGYYSVDIQRPLRLRVNLDDETLEKIPDDELVKLLKNYRQNLGTEILNDFNKFLTDFTNFAKKNSLTLTAKRKNFLREKLTEVDENAAPVKKSDGTFEPDKNLKDTEQISLTYDGGIEKFFDDEIKPFVPDAWIDEKSVVIGYEISFTKYFYKPEVLRSPKEIISDIREIENFAGNIFNNFVSDI